MDFSPARPLQTIRDVISTKIEAVLDIGVQYGTPCLMETFPNSHHFLFEPVTQYHESIKNLYTQKGIEFNLYNFAVSDKAQILYLHNLNSGNGSTSISHSHILPEKQPAKFGDRLHSVETIHAQCLDTWATTCTIPEPYIVKIDVDGVEDLIIKGASKVLSRASIVMVESDMVHLSSRLCELERLGMILFDIVGQGYYHEQLHQVDLILVSKKFKAENQGLRPWQITPGRIDWDKWKQFT